MDALVNSIVTNAELAQHFRTYLHMLNRRTYDGLNRFLARKIKYNDVTVTVPELVAQIPPGTCVLCEMLVADVAQRTVAARLILEMPIVGCGAVKRVSAMAFYEFDKQWRIAKVWSLKGGAGFH